MPGGNRMGPEGNGPMTGRQLGYCKGNDELEQTNQKWNFGRRAGMGRGRRFRFGFGNYHDQAFSTSSKVELLEREAKILKGKLASIEKQLSDTMKKND